MKKKRKKLKNRTVQWKTGNSTYGFHAANVHKKKDLRDDLF